MNIIIDTNLWISFLIGHQKQFMQQLLTDLRFDFFICPQLIKEICDVACRKKISKYIGTSDLDDMLAIIQAYCTSVDIKIGVSSSAVRDPKDLYLLSLAKTIDANYIISGDADLTDIGQFENTRIVKLSDFKEMMHL